MLSFIFNVLNFFTFLFNSIRSVPLSLGKWRAINSTLLLLLSKHAWTKPFLSCILSYCNVEVARNCFASNDHPRDKKRRPVTERLPQETIYIYKNRIQLRVFFYLNGIVPQEMPELREKATRGDSTELGFFSLT